MFFFSVFPLSDTCGFFRCLVRICSGRTCVFFTLKWFPSILGNDFYGRKECGNLSCIPTFVSCAQDNDYS